MEQRLRRRGVARGTGRTTGSRMMLALVGAVAVLLGALGLIAAQSATAAPGPTGTDTSYVVLAAGPADTGSGPAPGEGVGAPVEVGPSPLDTVADAVSAGSVAHLVLAPVLGLLALAGATVVVCRVGLPYRAPRRRTA